MSTRPRIAVAFLVGLMVSSRAHMFEGAGGLQADQKLIVPQPQPQVESVAPVPQRLRTARTREGELHKQRRRIVRVGQHHLAEIVSFSVMRSDAVHSPAPA